METPEAISAQAEAIQSVRAVNRAIERRLFHSQIAEWMSLNLSMGQVKAMMALAREAAPGMNVSALAEALHVGKPAASILVEQLVQQGYAERTEDHEDRRRTLVALTPLALDLVERLRQGGSEPFARWLGALEADDLAALTRGLRALLGAIESDTPQAQGGDDDRAEGAAGVTVGAEQREAPAPTQRRRATGGPDPQVEADVVAAGVR